MKSNFVQSVFSQTAEGFAKPQLGEYENQFLAILDQVTVGMAQIGLDGQWHLVNPAFCKMLGYRPEELLGRSIHDLLPIGDRDLDPTLLDQLFESSSSAAISNYHSPKVIQRFLHKTGDWVDLELTLHAVCDFRGTPKYFIAVLQSITSQSAIGQTLCDQAYLFDIAPVGIFVQNLEHRILFWNEGAENLYGWQKSEKLGKFSHDLYPENTSDLDIALLTVIETGTWQGELKQRTRSQQEIIVQSCWTLIDHHNQHSKMILVVNTDITQQKQREAQIARSQRLDSLYTLAGGFARHLDDLLTPILATAQLLSIHFPNADDHTQQLLELLETNTKRATKLIQQVLLFAGKSEPQKTLLNVEHSLVGTMHLLQATLPKSIETQLEIQPFNLGAITIDPGHWNSMLLNFCLNACDAMPHGGCLTVSANTELVHATDVHKPDNAPAGTYMALSVRDTGCGIPSEILDRIFEPFFTTKPHQSGIGLPLVAGIAKSYGGWVTVHSEIGKGSRFTLYLPWVNRQPNRSLPTVQQTSGDGEMILLVEDEMVTQVLIQTILEDNNYQVIAARNGLDAIKQYLKHQKQISVILMDIMMMVMDGITAIEKLQVINPDVKIIATSAFEPNRQIAINTGESVKSFLLKPYTAQELLSVINEVIRSPVL